ncbi:MAG: UDP-N-acetylglucosamine 2-epimerase (non-hydrolyzing) [Candidatus Omnitrophica bacterium]|nr:UDP-N-acetylglucosamine 2-epimerase (non-hydrolyzing) [Candidatus Omnitrophota bacterium]
MRTRNRSRILLAIGTRPEAIKMAPLVYALRRERSCQVLVCNTAQHRQMVDEVLELFNIKSDFDLDVMRHDQTIIYVQNTILERFSLVIGKCRPDMVVVQGDTTTALTAALAAFYQKVPVAHVEAGLRTFDKRNPFPEEINRRVISVVGDLHFAPTETSRRHLLREGIKGDAIHVVGNTVVDALELMLKRLRGSAGRELRAKSLWPKKARYVVLVTAHRRENWGEPMMELCAALKCLVRDNPEVVILWPVHPHPQVRKTVMGELAGIENISLLDPVRYDEFVYLLNKAYLVVTDSGGIQEEAASLGKPVLVFRETTERPEVIKSGVGELVPCSREPLYKRIAAVLADKGRYARRCRRSSVFGDGQAAKHIARIMVAFLKEYRKHV